MIMRILPAKGEISNLEFTKTVQNNFRAFYQNSE